MFYSRFDHVLCMLRSCFDYVLLRFCSCSLHVLCMLRSCSLHVLFTLCSCSLHVLCMFRSCSVHVSVRTFHLVDDAVQGERHLARHLHVVQHRVHRLRTERPVVFEPPKEQNSARAWTRACTWTGTCTRLAFTRGGTGIVQTFSPLSRRKIGTSLRGCNVCNRIQKDARYRATTIVRFSAM